MKMAIKSKSQKSKAWTQIANKVKVLTKPSIKLASLIKAHSESEIQQVIPNMQVMVWSRI